MAKKLSTDQIAELRKAFDVMDANKDGKITKDELGGGFGEKMLNHLDTDGDGRISKTEAESRHGKWRKHSE